MKLYKNKTGTLHAYDLGVIISTITLDMNNNMPITGKKTSFIYVEKYLHNGTLLIIMCINKKSKEREKITKNK